MKRPSKIVEVFVRKGQDEERLLSFNPPPDLPQGELITHGFALDGNRAARSIPQTASGGSFTARLFAAQQDIVTWLGGYGYQVEFR